MQFNGAPAFSYIVIGVPACTHAYQSRCSGTEVCFGVYGERLFPAFPSLVSSVYSVVIVACRPFWVGAHGWAVARILPAMEAGCQ